MTPYYVGNGRPAELVPELRPGTQHCWDCHDDVDNHTPCGEVDCACYCNQPDTPERMKRPPAVTR